MLQKGATLTLFVLKASSRKWPIARRVRLLPRGISLHVHLHEFLGR